MKRRQFIAAVGGALVWPAIARGQSSTKRQLAIYSPSEPETLMQEKSPNRYYRALFAQLRQLGHVEGENLVVERYGKETGAGGVSLVETIIKSGPDVIYAIGPGAHLFKVRTATIPIVALTGSDPAGPDQDTGASGRQCHRCQRRCRAYHPRQAGRAAARDVPGVAAAGFSHLAISMGGAGSYGTRGREGVRCQDRGSADRSAHQGEHLSRRDHKGAGCRRRCPHGRR